MKKCRRRGENRLTDYGEYPLSFREEVLCGGIGMLLSAAAAWLLYRSVFGLLSGLVLWPFYRRNYQKKQIEKQRRKLLLQFKDAMQSVSVALLSGYSIENSWKEAEKEIRQLYGEDAYMTEEIKQMNSGIKMNQPVEQLLYQFALRSGCEDIISFSEVFRFAKRSGGSFGKIIQNTTMRICEKIETEREIETVIAGKKMEQKVMNAVPVFLLGYLNLTSGEFLAPLYGSVFGVCVMTVAFAAYLGALLLSEKIANIRV